MSTLEISELDPQEHSLWDELVGASQEGTIFHTSDWVKTCGELSHKKPLFVGVFDQNTLLGGCSLYIRDLRFLTSATTVNSMTPFGGICMKRSESTKGKKQLAYRNSVMEAIRDHLKSHYDIVRLINSPGLVDIRPFKWDGWKSDVLFTNILSLDAATHDTTSRTVRSALKRAAKNEIFVERGDDATLYYELLKRTFERQNLAVPVPESFFTGMFSMIESKKLGEMWCAKTQSGETISSIIVLWDNKSVHAWSAASNPEYRDTGAQTLLFSEICSNLCGKGFKEFNLMTGNMPQLTAFYSSYNPILTPYYSVERFTAKSKIFLAIKNTFDNLNRRD
jgi:hypothetical protein